MRIAIYAIALNEANHIARWFESAKQADIIVLADTGSTDATVETARGLGVDVHRIVIDPWRFDDARNASLALIPKDIDLCIALDCDEVLKPGWREHLDNLPPEVTRPRYVYTWSWNDDGSPGLQYKGDKIHSRHGYRWHHPVHEVCTTNSIEVQTDVGLEIHHFPDSTKSRGSYMPLLELSVREDPTDDRNAHYYARELFNHGRIQEAAAEFKRHLALPRAIWGAERARSMQLLARCEPAMEESWLLRACAEDPSQREGWWYLAEFYYRNNRWEQCLAAATRCLSIEQRELAYISIADAWGFGPYDVAAIACFRLGLFERAVYYGSKALERAPRDQRLRTNLGHYMNGVQQMEMVAQPESRFTKRTHLCPNPGRWTSTDPDSTEIEVSDMIAGLVTGLQPSYCIETGAAFGQTTEAIGRALARNGLGTLDSIEPDGDRVTEARKRTAGLPVNVLQMQSLSFTPTQIIDFAFFDSLFALRVAEFRRYRPWMREGTIVCFHDTKPGHGRMEIASERDLRGEIEFELAGAINFVHLPTPRGITIGQVLGPPQPELQIAFENLEAVEEHLVDDVDGGLGALSNGEAGTPGVVVEGQDASWAEMLDSIQPVAEDL